MAAVDEIAIKLGVRTGDLKAALADANARIKTFKKDGEEGGNAFTKSFKNAGAAVAQLRAAIAGAGIVAALRSITDAAVKFAEEYKGAFDADVAATLRLKESQQDLGSIVQQVSGRIGVTLVGAMEKFGIAVGALVFGTDAAADALTKLDAESRKAFDDAQAKKLREEEEKLAKVRRDSAQAQASANEKVNLLAGEYVKLLQEQARLQQGSIEWTKKTIEVETSAAALRKADSEAREKEAQQRKKIQEDTVKAAEEEKKNRAELGQRRALDMKEEAELFVLQRKNVTELTAAEKARKKELEDQVIIKIKQVEIEELLTKKVEEGLTPEEAKRLAELIKQLDTLRKQVDTKATIETTSADQLPTEEAITAEMHEQHRLARMIADEAARNLQIEQSRQILIRRTGTAYEGQSTESLEGVRSRVKKQLDQVKQENALAGKYGYQNPMEFALQSEFEQIERELASRRNVSRYADERGEDAARFKYGDTLTDKALRDMQTDAKRTAVALEAIRNRLENTL